MSKVLLIFNILIQILLIVVEAELVKVIVKVPPVFAEAEILHPFECVVVALACATELSLKKVTKPVPNPFWFTPPEVYNPTIDTK